MAKGYALSKDTLEKVLNTVDVVERQAKNLPHELPPPRPPTSGFLARITGSDGSGRYNWEVVNFDQYGDMTATPDQMKGDYTTGENFACEVRGLQVKDVLVGDFVRLHGARTQNILQFIYSPGVQPVVTSSVISARSGNTPGTGIVTVEKYDSSSGDLVSGQSITCYNSLSATINSGKNGHATFGDGGLWWFTAEDCTNA